MGFAGLPFRETLQGSQVPYTLIPSPDDPRPISPNHNPGPAGLGEFLVGDAPRDLPHVMVESLGFRVQGCIYNGARI